ncbi:NAD(P)/FAD-dependent oxidoreductase [Terriglobus roseus]|uniref:Dehydrogenase (Flavoprotein) n=1 Tax=Terriglobus roseus TaxID=392734 RepID=A0A1H4NXT9_9BACT|nr:FAD-dependent monooxygenase [Terriglobus roseus]SEB99835.1 Dehydrogenase (flavoprotein) [Terriglobus roseus]
MTPIDAEALIVGGGLAGSMVALELAKAGRGAVLLERSKAAHHKVCGEFLSAETIHYLARHNVDLPALGAISLHSVRLVLRRGIVEDRLPFAAYSLTRSVLDEALLTHAAAAGVVVERNSAVEHLQPQGAAWCASVRDGRSFRSANIFLATGKHDLRGFSRPAGTHRGLIAFKMYYRLTPQQHAQLGAAVELILFPGGYAGLQPVEDGRVNLCLLVTGKCLKSVGSNWAGLVPYLFRHAPHLEERLRGAVSLLDAPLTASHIPYGHMQAASRDGLWHLGDQAAVIPSFCGDGMAIALHSGAVAAHHFLKGDRAETYQLQLRSQLGRRLALATRLSQAMVAWPEAAQIARLVPGLLSRIASMTRIPDTALLR